MVPNKCPHTKIILALFLTLFSLCLFSQTTEIGDTSYFVPWDDNYNLLLAANKSDIGSIILLLNRGASINTSTVEGVTPLMYASENGNIELVKLLVERDADINKKPFNGATALIVASKLNHYEISEYLVSKKAELNIRDIEGVTAVHFAAALNNFDVMDMLVFYGADLELADNDGNTPLITAAYNNCLEAADLLLQNGASINAVDFNGYTALMTAIQNDNVDVALLLIEKGADIHIINKGGYTALTFAVAASNFELTETLINMGADVNQKTGSGYTIMEIARYSKDDEIIELLRSNGAKYNINPHFNTLSFGPYLDFNFTDFMTGIQVGTFDNKYGISLNGGFGFRPAANRVLFEVSNSLTYQYWEKRYFFYAGLDKKFSFIRDNNFSTGPYVGVNEFFSFGGYRGSDKNPQKRFITSPSAGWFYSTNSIRSWLGYQYIDYKTPEIKPGRFTLGICINISLIKRSYTNKGISWLE